MIKNTLGKGTTRDKVLKLCLFGLLLILPTLITSRYIIHVLVMLLSFTAMSVAWNIIGGFGGQISWCHSAFYGIGAYTSFLMFLRLNVTPLLSIFLGMIISAGVAFLIGYPSFRLRGVYFSLATIAFGEIFKLLLLYFKDFTGGANGLMIPFKNPGFLSLQFRSEVPFYYIMLVLTLITLYVSYKFQNSRYGLYLRAIREDEDAAQSLGIESHKVKLIALMVSAMMVSAVGTIAAFNTSYIDPESVSSLEFSIRLGVISIIGGAGTLWGPVLGAALVIPLTEITNAVFGSTRSGASTAIYGLVLMLFVLFQPNGLIALVTRKKKKARHPLTGKKEVTEGQ